MDIGIPDKIGFYWFKHEETQRWRPTEVFFGKENVLCAYHTWTSGFFGHDKIDSNSSVYSVVEDFDGEWYGPVEDPKRMTETEKNYHELIMSVARIFPDETRHETALRYIQEAEKQHESASVKAC